MDAVIIAHNLPVQPTQFVGRRREIDEAVQLLSDPACRLLTLVGPGGIGKTRLSVEIGQRLQAEAAPDYPDGVFFIPLQALEAPELMVTSIADEAGFQFFQGAKPREQLLDYLSNKRLLLLLDNMEHLLAGVGFLSELLSCAPGVKLLVTSREALNLQEEWVYPLSGMSLPQTNDREALDNSSAARLFIQQARRVYPAFSVETEWQGIARICSLVGGMPLGIELAAAWVRAMSCAEIADEIEHNLNILETTARNIPERHRTMRGVLVQSWALLTEAEQQVMRQLAVFQGGFSREAAEAVVGVSLQGLTALVDKSWLRWDSGSRRYDVHELLRQYAAEQLEAAGEIGKTRDCHADYYAEWMQKREGEIKYRKQDAALNLIEQEFANVRLAWQRAYETRRTALLNQMMEALNFFCDMRAHFVEGREMFEKAALALSGMGGDEAALTILRLDARRCRMIVLGLLFDYKQIDHLIGEIEAIAAATEAYNSPTDIAFALLQVGMARFHRLEFIHYDLFKRSYTAYAAVNDQFYMAELLTLMGLHAPNFETANRHCQEALALQREIDDRNGLGWTLMNLARLNYLEHNYEAGEAHSREAVEIQRQRGDQKGLNFSLTINCIWAIRRGEWDEALVTAEEGLRIARNLNMIYILKSGLANLGLLLILSEMDLERGEALCREAVASHMPRHANMTEGHADALCGLAVTAYLKGDLTELRQHYAGVMDYICDFWNIEIANDCISMLSPIAILVLDLEGRIEEAVELLAVISSIPDEPGQPPTGWLAKWPLLHRLEARWQSALGEAAYAAAWASGRRCNTSYMVDWLMDGMIPAEADEISTPEVTSPLTPREQEILTLLAAGLSNREIAEQLVFSVGTVKWYVNQIYSKLGVGSRTQAVARGRDMHLLT